MPGEKNKTEGLFTSFYRVGGGKGGGGVVDFPGRKE